ncbi:hypothetical protein [Streptomyces acidicola]|uniref:Uncharacterized protein n=1 Tax=Streptomyces acidicola TaxID=2596892 RepID=A0A5N8WP43_9ACTN|nr:hypothetical protein [Streptomyces acidicola]MPY49009.1 hypothetical protein [Streptomyces acidicola]
MNNRLGVAGSESRPVFWHGFPTGISNWMAKVSQPALFTVLRAAPWSEATVRFYERGAPAPSGQGPP